MNTEIKTESRSWERQGPDFPLEPPKGTILCEYLDFSA